MVIAVDLFAAPTLDVPDVVQAHVAEVAAFDDGAVGLGCIPEDLAQLVLRDAADRLPLRVIFGGRHRLVFLPKGYVLEIALPEMVEPHPIGYLTQPGEEADVGAVFESADTLEGFHPGGTGDVLQFLMHQALAGEIVCQVVAVTLVQLPPGSPGLELGALLDAGDEFGIVIHVWSPRSHMPHPGKTWMGAAAEILQPLDQKDLFLFGDSCEDLREAWFVGLRREGAMVTAARPANDRIHVATDQEWRTLVDGAAHHYLGMSGDEFLRAWERGAFVDADRPEVLRVAMLLPLGR